MSSSAFHALKQAMAGNRVSTDDAVKMVAVLVGGLFLLLLVVWLVSAVVGAVIGLIIKLLFAAAVGAALYVAFKVWVRSRR